MAVAELDNVHRTAAFAGFQFVQGVEEGRQAARAADVGGAGLRLRARGGQGGSEGQGDGESDAGATRPGAVHGCASAALVATVTAPGAVTGVAITTGAGGGAALARSRRIAEATGAVMRR